MRTTIDRIGKYELKAVLARTPVSTVYDGWDADIARRVAIKLMPLHSWGNAEAGEALARFKRGAQAAGQLNHPNIVGVYDYGETDDYAYLVMEFVDGPTLKALFDDNQRFDAAEICQIIGSILDALQYSHDRGVVHRDVKPANIMFSKNHQVKITDFGIARLEDSEMTQAGMVIGTPAYMSPEQFLGEKIDLRTDIYSAGVVLYHMLTGERPYEGNLATIMHKVLYGSPLPPSRVSTVVTPALDAVVTRAMARSREDRFSAAAEFNAALQAARLAAPPRHEPLAATDWASHVLRRAGRGIDTTHSRKLGFLALAMALLAAIGGIGWYAFDRVIPTRPSNQANEQPQASKTQPQNEQALKQARINQVEQDRIQLQQRRLEQQEEEEEQARLKLAQQQQEQARLQQQEQARLQQQQEQARLQQQEQARQQQERARQQQQQDQARLQQQEQARLQQQEQARQQQDQARIRQEQEDARIRLALEQARQKMAERDRPPPVPPPPPPRGPQKEQLRPQQEAPPAPPRPAAPSYPVHSTSGLAGLLCESVTADTAPALGLDSPQGMIATGVTTGGAAYKAGIRPNDVILKINGSEVHDLSSLSSITANGSGPQSVPLEILSHGARRVVQLDIGQGHQ